jgi:hypothetical protein
MKALNFSSIGRANYECTLFEIGENSLVDGNVLYRMETLNFDRKVRRSSVKEDRYDTLHREDMFAKKFGVVVAPTYFLEIS